MAARTERHPITNAGTKAVQLGVNIVANLPEPLRILFGTELHTLALSKELEHKKNPKKEALWRRVRENVEQIKLPSSALTQSRRACGQNE